MASSRSITSWNLLTLGMFLVAAQSAVFVTVMQIVKLSSLKVRVPFATGEVIGWKTKDRRDANVVTFDQHHRPVVVLATDHHAPYLFYVPLTLKMWDRVMNHSVMIFTVGNEKDWEASPLLNYSLQQIRKAVAQSPGSVHLFVNATVNQTRSVAQTIRIFAPALSGIHPSVRMITSDIDLWPVNPHWLDVNPGTDLVLTNAFCCRFQMVANVKSRHYPMCHISATAGLWRRIMNYSTLVESSTDLASLLTASLDALFGKDCTSNILRGGPGWFMDQLYVSYRIAVTSNLSGDLVTRRRLDPKNQRLHSQDLLDLHSKRLKLINDAHLPAYNGTETWTILRGLLKFYVATHELLELDGYESKFRFLTEQQ